MGPWWPLIAITFSAVVKLQLFGNAFSDVNLRFQTVDASIRLVGSHHDTADAATTKA